MMELILDDIDKLYSTMQRKIIWRLYFPLAIRMARSHGEIKYAAILRDDLNARKSSGIWNDINCKNSAAIARTAIKTYRRKR